MALANSTFIKEDRLKLLASLAKQMKLKNLPEDKNLTDQIKILYEQIDFTKINEVAFEIASLLVYSSFELAIDLVEKLSDNTASQNSLDYAFAFIALSASAANKQNNNKSIDTSIFNNKIKNADVKNLSNALDFLSGDYNSSQIIENVKILTKFNYRLFILKSWILKNIESPNVAEVVRFSLEEIVKTSTENVPDASSLAAIAKPMPKIKDQTVVEQLLQLFDAQKNSIVTPTRDYVELQLLLAEATLRFDITKAKDRIFDIYYLIDELNDLSVKTDCLALLWIWLIRNDQNGQIERSISSELSVETQVKANIDSLLQNTAYHEVMTEFLIRQIITTRPDFVFELITKINTQARKDEALKTGITNYIDQSKIEDLDLPTVKKFYREIKNAFGRETVIIEVIEKFYREKEKVTKYIPALLEYYDLIDTIKTIENKCYVITHSLKILNFDRELYSRNIEDLLSLLFKSWEGIDFRPNQIQIGFLIAKNLSEFSKEHAIKYLNLATQLKQSESFSSNSIVETYTLSTRLCIRSFSGLILIREDLENELTILNDIISQIQSTGTKLEFWSEIALRFHAARKLDYFKSVFKTKITPLLDLWRSVQNNDQIRTIVSISPTLFLYNGNVFHSDYLSKLPEEYKDSAINNICEFILTKLVPDDLRKEGHAPSKVDYPELMDVCTLMTHLNSDLLIYDLVKNVVACLRDREHQNHLTAEHKNSIKQKINNIIETKFPTTTGIQHEGYKVISEAEVLTLEPYKAEMWKPILERARNIPNLSDRAYIISIIAKIIEPKSKAKKLELIDEAFDLIKKIPATYDKSNRFDLNWETILDIDKGQFNKYLHAAFLELLKYSDGGITDLRNLIDTAQQYDPKLASACVTLLDHDEARKKLKAPLLQRIENNSKIKTACNEYSTLKNLTSKQFGEVFSRNVSEMNSGRMVSRDIYETLEVVETASTLSLSESFEAYLYFIQNANKRLESKKDNDLLDSIFQATVENTKLVAILSSDNVNKMKNLYNRSKRKTNELNSIISAGERDLAISRIQNWLNKNQNKKMFFIDPYFTENDLDILRQVQEVNPQCEVWILTSKKNGINSHKDIDRPNRSINKEVYIRAWGKISSQPPLPVKIKIVWDKESKECPFHDRWYISGEIDSCLHIGTSRNGLGNRDSQIIELTGSELLDAKAIVDRYIYREETSIDKFNLKYEQFDLDEFDSD